MICLREKKILIISVKFFNYENLIADELRVLGGNVDMFDERPSNSFFSKAIIRLKKSIYTRKIDKYFHQIISQIKDIKYDFFLLIKGEVTPIFFLDFLKSNNPNIVFIYYTYDSFKNNPNGLKVLNRFDRVFSFDPLDSKKYKIGFRPLFFASEYDVIKNDPVKPEYDLSFVGTAHSDRYTISQKITLWGKQVGLKVFNFYYSPSKILFIFKKLTDKNFDNFDRSKISFKSLRHDEIIKIYRKSKAILDINHPGQNGLTMRTFETLGAGRKLVTTNESIKDYPFYSPQNIFIINRENPHLDLSFFEGDFKDIDTGVLYSMSLRGWIEELFESESNIWKIE